MKKAHDWYNVSDLMSCKYNDMINTVMTFSVNRFTRSMKTEVKLSWSRSRLLHWMRPVIGFCHIFNSATYQYKGVRDMILIRLKYCSLDVQQHSVKEVDISI